MPPPAEGFAARFVVGPALRTQPDRRLVKLVREGYENAFEEIVRRYGKPLTRYAAAIVGGRAEDVTQDAFSKALLAMRREGKEIELRPWLFRIVRNTALNDLRDRPPSPETLAEALAGGATPEEEIERREELADLMRRLQSLPDAQRAAIVMRELEGLSHEEIAAALGLSGGAARQAIFRARRALRDGAGMLLPLPLLKGLIAAAANAPVEVAAGTAGIGGAAGIGVATKATMATVLVAGAVGAGVAIDHNRQANPPQARAGSVVADDSSAAPAGDVIPAESGEDSGSTDEEGQRHGSKPGGEHGNSEDDGGRGHGGGSGGRGSGEESSSADEHGGRRGPGGEGELEPGDDHGGDGSSGHGGTSSGGGSGHQSGRSADDSSGHGDDGASSGSGSGSPAGGDDSSGSGSGSGGDGGFEEGSNSGSGDLSGSDGGSDSSGDSSSDGGSDGSGSGDSSSSGGSGDSHGGDGFSLQTEPQS